MSALAQAFQSAGYVPPADRLHAILLDVCRLSDAEWADAAGAGSGDDDGQQRRLMQVAIEAVKNNRRNWDSAKDAFYSAVRNDAGLLWELFAPYRSQAVQLLMSKAAAELRELERAQHAAAEPSVPGQCRSGNQNVGSRRADMQSSSGSVQASSVHQGLSDRPARSLEERRAAMSAVAEVVKLSLLDTFKINGQPIGDLTPREAIGWASSRERDARFVRLLTANLPLDTPIRVHCRAEDTQAIYDQASQEINDAQ